MWGVYLSKNISVYLIGSKQLVRGLLSQISEFWVKIAHENGDITLIPASRVRYVCISKEAIDANPSS